MRQIMIRCLSGLVLLLLLLGANWYTSPAEVNAKSDTSQRVFGVDNSEAKSKVETKYKLFGSVRVTGKLLLTGTPVLETQDGQNEVIVAPTDQITFIENANRFNFDSMLPKGLDSLSNWNKFSVYKGGGMIIEGNLTQL